MRKTAVVAAMLVAILGGGRARAAGPPVDLTVQLGAVIPDGSLGRYADTGFSILGRGVYHIPSAPALGLWGDVHIALFANETIPVTIPVGGAGGIPIPVDQTTTQTGVNFHVGLQLGSGNRRAFFRPRAGLGIGAYNFSTEITWKGLNADEPLAKATTDSDWGWGLRGQLGADFFVSPRWGIAADLLFDQVYSLEKQKGGEVDDSTSGFTGIMLGATFALDRMP